MRFTSVAWAVQPNSNGSTRPEQLMKALAIAGDKSVEYYFHGRSASSGSWHNAGLLRPSVPKGVDASRHAVLSPVFLDRKAAWIDMYDDWSIAPDINILASRRARKTYSEIARGNYAASTVVTCNSEYLRRKLRLPFRNVIPNGVDGRLAQFARQGDDQRRLVILGHFFKGRTDFALVESVARQGRFDEIVIGGDRHRTLAGAIDPAGTGTRVTWHDWLDPRSLAGISGSMTVALVPHVVSDYTLSQDIMKAYQFLALGIPVICPRMLWPTSLPLDYAYLTEIGTDVRTTLSQWVGSVEISQDAREVHVAAHSWNSRAARIEGLIRERV